MRLSAVLTALCAVLAAGCADLNYPVQTKPENVLSNPKGDVHRYDDLNFDGLEINAIVSRMADQLERYKVPSTEDLPGLAIATFVNVHNYASPEGLGRILAEDFIHEMHRRGELVVDHHLTGYVEVDTNGDITLSRKAEQLARRLSVSRFLIGTIARHPEGYVINARIVSMKTRNVEATAVGIVPYKLVPYPAHSVNAPKQVRSLSAPSAVRGGQGATGGARAAGVWSGREGSGLIIREENGNPGQRHSVMKR